MSSSIVVDDLVILGRAVPEPIKGGRTTVCLGGFSYNYGFIRIYPTKTDMTWSRWDVVKVEVEKDPRDSRNESWKIFGSKAEWDSLSEKIEVEGSINSSDDQRNLIANIMDDCVKDINDSGRSLGIVRPTVLERYFAENPRYGELFQMALPGFGESTKVKRDFPSEPRVKYRCSNCKNKNPHNQQILEWGFYEWSRKHPDNLEQVWENAQFDSKKHDLYFFVGNLFRHRSGFMVISVLRIQKGSVIYPLIPYKK